MKKEKRKSYNNKNSNNLLAKKRGKEYSTEEIIYMYCIKNKIKENEIKMKINNFEYNDPNTGEIINYEKDKNEDLPIHKEKLHKYFNNKKKVKIHNKIKIKKIKSCNFCNKTFPEMNEKEKIKHLIQCFDSV